jgi:hypothetical protein
MIHCCRIPGHFQLPCLKWGDVRHGTLLPEPFLAELIEAMLVACLTVWRLFICRGADRSKSPVAISRRGTLVFKA